MIPADVIVIGAGIMGLSTAYHLAAKGCRSVIVLEKGPVPGCGSTGKNAGGIRHQFSSRINVELSRLSFEMFRNFEEEFDQDIDLNLCGYLFLLDSEASLAVFRKSVALQNSLGIESEILRVSEIGSLIPEFRLDGILGGAFHANDGLADPAGVVAGYARRSREMGVMVRCGSAVTGIRVVHGRVQGVETATEFCPCRAVLIAAGPWSGRVGRMAGIDLPVVPLRRQLAITRTPEKMRRDLPFVVEFSRSLYFHYESDGILTGMSNPDEVPGFGMEIDEEWREIHLEAAVERLPLLARAELVAEWAGLYEMTPDCQPILGSVPGIEGLYVCTGFSGHGFMHGPACGLLLAEEILDGRAAGLDIDELRIARFSGKKHAGEFNVI